MDIRFSCTGCGQHLAADEKDVGVHFLCPHCSRAVTVPRPAAKPRPKASAPAAHRDFPKVNVSDKGKKAAPPSVHIQHSRLGLASFLVSLGVGLVVLFPSIWKSVTGATIVMNPLIMMLVLFVAAIVSLLSLGLGIFALVQKERKKLFGVIGTVTAGCVLALAVMRMIQGM
jgi:uncharacterized membrane protein